MVNTEEFTKRLKTVMDYYELSAASFADRIDVGRSSISHLLSGRNKPSLDFVMRIISAFPEVELYWLLNGKGSFPYDTEVDLQYNPPGSEQQQPDLFTEQETQPMRKESQSKRRITKIVIFYADGGFDAFEN